MTNQTIPSEMRKEVKLQMKEKKQRPKGRPRKKPNLEEFELLYYNPSITIYELAEHWKVKPQTIYNWASYYSKNK